MMNHETEIFIRWLNLLPDAGQLVARARAKIGSDKPEEGEEPFSREELDAAAADYLADDLDGLLHDTLRELVPVWVSEDNVADDEWRQSHPNESFLILLLGPAVERIDVDEAAVLLLKEFPPGGGSIDPSLN